MNHIYYKNNDLIHAIYSMTSIQNKISNMLYYETDLLKEFKEIPVEGEEFTIFKIKISFFSLRKKFKNNISFNQIRNFFKEMMNVRISIYSKNKEISDAPFIFRVNYDVENKDIDIFLMSDMYYAVKDNKKGFTPLDLEILETFQSTYSQRFYELLRSWSNTKNEIILSVAHLKKIFGVEKKYKKYADFKINCVIKAIKEINNSNYMQISLTEIKKGRRVEELLFTVQDNVPRVIDESKKKENLKEHNNSHQNIANKQKQKVFAFNNYSQREYDYDSLEKQLLGWDE